MKRKTVTKIITTKLNEFLSSIKDESLSKQVKESLLVSGGSITSLFLNLDVNDYDIYIQDREVLLRLIQYYINPFEKLSILDGHNKETYVNGIQEEYRNQDIATLTNQRATAIRTLKEDQLKIYIDGGGGFKIELSEEDKKDKSYYPVFFSPNAISLSDSVQIVVRFWGNPSEIHKTFDFIHATNYFTFKDGLVTNIAALESILSKQLYYQGSLYPVTSIIRAKKFIKRGWNIGSGEYLKIMFQISLLDLTNPDVLEEQLIGIDISYFSILIEALRNKQSSDKDFILTHGYLCELVDRIFNSIDDTLDNEE